jgi:hypothetical protein
MTKEESVPLSKVSVIVPSHFEILSMIFDMIFKGTSSLIYSKGSSLFPCESSLKITVGEVV